MLEISKFAPAAFPDIPDVPGVLGATASCQLKESGEPDLLLVSVPPGSAVAGVLTQSTVTSYAVQRCRSSLPGGRARALIVHSGNANALTGAQGRRLVERVCDDLAVRLGCPSDEVFMAATGIIGERVSDDQILAALPPIVDSLGAVSWEAAANTIRTTDTFAKAASRRLTVGAQEIVVSGIAKGSGMIAPDMATMLCFIFTNAAVDPVELQRMLHRANATSFRRITVDGDESTSDTMLLFATQQADLGAEGDADAALESLQQAVTEVASDLAMQVVSDGEGITKLVEVTVTGARTADDAEAMARSIASSPLVKTAVAGGHANWGRIAMAVGKTHRPVCQEQLAIWIGGQQVAIGGDRNDAVDDDALAAAMAADRIAIAVDVAMGDQSATIWTCDLTHGYIEINAHYVT